MSDICGNEVSFPAQSLGLGLSLLIGYGADECECDEGEPTSLSLNESIPPETLTDTITFQKNSDNQDVDGNAKVESELPPINEDGNAKIHDADGPSNENNSLCSTVLPDYVNKNNTDSAHQLSVQDNSISIVTIGFQTPEDSVEDTNAALDCSDNCIKAASVCLLPSAPSSSTSRDEELPITRQSNVSDSATFVTPKFFVDKSRRNNPFIEDFSSDSETDSPSSTESSLSTSESSSSSEEEPEPQIPNKKPPPSSNHKTKGELSLEDLPPLEDLHISVPETDVHLIGHVRSIVGTQVIVESLANERPLDLESVLFLSSGKSFGKIFDVFGQVVQPMYSVRFNSKEDIDSYNVKIGDPIYSAPEHKDVTIFIFTETLKREKGTDASWEHNNEPPPEFLDFSDDEEERTHKQKLRAKHRNGDKTDKNDSPATPIRKPRIQNNGLPPRHFLRPQQFQVRQGNNAFHHWRPPGLNCPSPTASQRLLASGPADQFQFQRFPPPPPPPPPLPQPPQSFISSSGPQSNVFHTNSNMPQPGGPPPYMGSPPQALNGNFQPRPSVPFSGMQNCFSEPMNTTPDQFQSPQSCPTGPAVNGPHHWGGPRPNHSPPVRLGLPSRPPNFFRFQGQQPPFHLPPGPFPNSFQPFQTNQRMPQFGEPPPFFGPQQFNAF